MRRPWVYVYIEGVDLWLSHALVIIMVRFIQ